jgi:nucleoside-diphosphate kinase
MGIIKRERTLVIIKPDGIQRSLIGEILGRYERVGLKLVALKMMIPSEEHAVKHYHEVGGEEWLENVGAKARAAYEKKGLKSPYKTNKDNGWAVLKANAKYLSAGPVVCMVWEGNQACAIVRKLTGATEPLSSDVGTVRGDLTIDSYQAADTDQRSVRNLIHASGNPEESAKEIKIWFRDEELLKYNHIQERMIYDVNLDGIKE